MAYGPYGWPMAYGHGVRLAYGHGRHLASGRPGCEGT